MSIEEVDVVVVGCGPVGALTANLLGRHDVRTLVVERGTEPHRQPRAFSCDDEALRIYQLAGLRDEVAADMYAPSTVEYVDSAARPFATIALDEIDFGLGAPPLHFFDQPILEEALRKGFDRFPHVELRTATEMVELTQDADGVTVVLLDVESGRHTTVRARYVLGCDGARSATRVAAGIDLVGTSYAEPWLALTGDVPPEAVRVPVTQFVCDWNRPGFVSPGAIGTHRLEFMLRDGETPEEMTDPATIARLAAPYVDPDRFTVTRAVVYTFHHVVAARWRAGRVLLLGDAAHQMPPFLGQGLCSGLRDAANLTWKIALVVQGRAGDTLLDTYEAERRPHTEEMAVTSVRLGRVFLVRKRWAAALRDAALRTIQTIPRVRRFVRHFEFKPLPAVGKGKRPVGVMFPQPAVLVAGSPEPRLLDDVLGAGFVVIGPDVDERAATTWSGPPATFVRVLPPGAALGGAAPGGLVDIGDPAGVLAAWFARHQVGAVVLRPDRFVYATGVTAPAW
ncbi:3-(3-hydroxy-phenyl)propionate hydroxylase [Asanoa ferruginea]|uniref:3-(3-hydroxy-phenyl)propionate hydroxylase n=1 Tax=Asanoa ferruginea TaxID=53367 RepID=A0A3D9ZXL7_9ACTN|nr:bifunctional 3-(3-hydroxy-phenyl)propionate/3-hydroxycinnamic acid hydroxylase [Asanoa ferruginea]REG01345.1 3-(3-hydroxy-phenyl)propionate hydroxylase [Asanoa ferruginea]GIF52165.1 3-(3-hydroxy-phenyl)propionate/3-hydroxycinnamic acid hydroxylase [Asanoa ferruginea]